MSLYPRAIKKLIPPGPNDPRINPTCVILHVAVSESASLYSYFNGPSGGVESHFYVRRDGTVEQYRDTSYQADAQLGAAWDEVSIETQGMGSGTWTPQQITALVDLIRWLSTVHPIPLRLNDSETNPRGIGWHAQYRSWSGGDGRTCPGVDRVPQIKTQIIPALTKAPSPTLSKPSNPAPKEGATMALSSSEIDAIALRVLRIDAVPAPGRPKTGNTSWQLDSYVRLTYEAVARIETQNKALVAAVSALSKSQGLDPAKVQAAIDAAVKDALAGLSITLTA